MTDLSIEAKNLLSVCDRIYKLVAGPGAVTRESEARLLLAEALVAASEQLRVASAELDPGWARREGSTR